jgi:hypothetical protein
MTNVGRAERMARGLALTALVISPTATRGARRTSRGPAFPKGGGTGDALIFSNVAADGHPGPLALHAGPPVTRDTKYPASRGIGAERFTFPPRRPLLNP